jgi:predicted ATP-binding protein involved in virulence
MNRPDETWHRLLNWTYDSTRSEGLAAQVLLDQGFTSLDPSHPLGGKDGGMDALCMKDGQRWIMAVYFPRGQQDIGNIKKKFAADLAGVAKNGAVGIAFVTNQELTLGERASLRKLCEPNLLEVFHLERITVILDQPRMASVRQKFLFIDAASPKQAGFLLSSDWSNILVGNVEGDALNVNGQRHLFPLQYRPKPGNGASIAGILTWNSRIPEKLIGRATEMADLDAWAELDDDVRLRVLHGVGGVGKTRLAVEFGDLLRTRGWAVCMISSARTAHAFEPGAAGTLLIIDYPEYQPQAVQNLLQLLKSGGIPKGRWRVLLLSRKNDIVQEIDQVVPNLRDASLEVKALASSDQAWELFQQGRTQMQRVLAIPASPALARKDFNAWLAQDPHNADPLLILAFALNLLYDPSARGLGRAYILQSVVRRECARIKQTLLPHPDVQYEGTLLLKAITALTGGLSMADVGVLKANLQDDEIQLPGALALKRTPLWLDDVLPAIQPDILAAQLIHVVFQDYLATPARIGEWVWQGLILGDPDVEQLRGRLSRLANLSIDWSGQVGGQYLLIDVLELDQDKAFRLEQVFETGGKIEWPLLDLAVKIQKLLLPYWEAKAAQDYIKYRPHLAACLTNLAAQLGRKGEKAGALRASQRAVQIFDDLAQQNFPAYGANLASALINLSNGLAANGEQADALVAIQRAVTIHETLKTDAPNWAKSLGNLAIVLEEQGELIGALTAIQKALPIYEDLAQKNFTVYGAAFADCLTNQAIFLAKCGDQASALAITKKAAALYDVLSQQNFAAHAPSLAVSLHNLTAHLIQQGDTTGALVAINRAIEIYNLLAQQNSSIHAPNLARSLGFLATLTTAPSAIATLQRAISLISPYVLPNTKYEQWHNSMRAALRARIPEFTPIIRLNHLTLQNYRAFDQIGINFEPDITVLVAENGQGKTTLLDACRIALWPFVAAFDLARTANTAQYGIAISDIHWRKKAESNWERQFPSRIRANGDVGAVTNTDWIQVLDNEAQDSQTKDGDGTAQLRDWAKLLQDQIRASGQTDLSLPVFAYYGTSRLWSPPQASPSLSEITSGKANNDIYIRTFAYRDCLEPASSYQHFSDWFRWIYTSHIETESKNRAQNLPPDTPSPWRDTIHVVQQAIDSLLKEATGWHTLEFSISHENSLILHNDQQLILKAAQLSDGIRNMLAMVGDLAYRCIKINPHLGKQAALQATGVVLIDEIDMHLHPGWQQQVVGKFREAFPKLQFIVTTHSPQVLSTVRRENIRVIGKNTEGRMIATSPLAMTYGEPSGDVMHSVMLVDPQPPVPEKADLDRLTELVDQGEHSSDEVAQLWKKLDAKLGETHPQLQRLHRSIRRQVALKR